MTRENDDDPEFTNSCELLVAALQDELAKPPRLTVSQGGLEALLAAAAAHGKQSEPDHEVGDLQEVLRSCWELMDPRQQREVMDQHRELLSWIPNEEEDR
jgi:hypothetical protein